MKLSLCMICKNEEKKIARCINSVKEVVDEMIIVDTGSDDHTIEIAKSLGAQVFEIVWEKNFAKAKNVAIDKATGDWIIFLDADEYLIKESATVTRKLIKEAIQGKKECVYCELLNEHNGQVTSSFKANRIFKRSSKLRYKGRVHERLWCEKEDIAAIDFSDQIKIRHDGYSEEVWNAKNKEERNTELLLEELKEDPTNSDLYYYLMQVAMKDQDKAWEYGIKAIEYDNFKLLGSKESVYDLLLTICSVAKKDSQLTYRLYNEAIKENKLYPDFDFRYGVYLYDQEMYNEAIEHLNLCLNKAEKYKGTILSRVRGDLVLVFEVLGNAYLRQQDYGKAIPIIVKMLRINPYRVKELYNLINILQEQESGTTIGQMLSRLYDYSKIKDQLLLLQISKEVGNAELYEYILQFADDVVKEQINA